MKKRVSDDFLSLQKAWIYFSLLIFCKSNHICCTILKCLYKWFFTSLAAARSWVCVDSSSMLRRFTFFALFDHVWLQFRKVGNYLNSFGQCWIFFKIFPYFQMFLIFLKKFYLFVNQGTFTFLTTVSSAIGLLKSTTWKVSHFQVFRTIIFR